MTDAQFKWGLAYWIGFWFIGAFVIPELLALFGKTPWKTLSETVWQIEFDWKWATFFIVLGLLILIPHFAKWSLLGGGFGR